MRVEFEMGFGGSDFVGGGVSGSRGPLGAVKKAVKRPGRPRNPQLDDALLEAAVDVFFERGYHRATYAEIARRVGVGIPTMYRRWPTKLDMAFAVVRRKSRPEAIPDTGSIRRDLAGFVRRRLREYSSPLFHHVIIPMAMEAWHDAAAAQRIRDMFLVYRAPNIEPRIRKAIAAGELRRDTDPHLLANLLMGPVTIQLLFAHPLPRKSEAQTIVDMVLDGFAARGPRPPGKPSRSGGR
jgi:AcrR family transcriptional regulator